MKTPRNTAGIFNTISRLERQMGVDVGLRDTAEHLYRPIKKVTSNPLTPSVVMRLAHAETVASTN